MSLDLLMPTWIKERFDLFFGGPYWGGIGFHTSDGCWSNIHFKALGGLLGVTWRGRWHWFWYSWSHLPIFIWKALTIKEDEEEEERIKEQQAALASDAEQAQEAGDYARWEAEIMEQ